MQIDSFVYIWLEGWLMIDQQKETGMLGIKVRYIFKKN